MMQISIFFWTFNRSTTNPDKNSTQPVINEPQQLDDHLLFVYEMGPEHRITSHVVHMLLSDSVFLFSQRAPDRERTVWWLRRTRPSQPKTLLPSWVIQWRRQ